jgi:hypothetical protein
VKLRLFDFSRSFPTFMNAKMRKRQVAFSERQADGDRDAFLEEGPVRMSGLQIESKLAAEHSQRSCGLIKQRK